MSGDILQSAAPGDTMVAAPPPARAALTGRSHALLLCAALPPFGWVAVHQYLRARGRARDGDAYAARVHLSRAREWAWYAVATAVAVLIVGLVVVSLTSNDHAVITTFFNGQVLRDSLPSVLTGFWLNVRMFLLAEALVLPWAFLVAAVRMMPGRAFRPIRALAIVYVDLFRGMPAVIVIYLIAFGLPIAGLPVLAGLSGFKLCVLALVLVYGAYVSEVFRAGLESVHWSQSAAARSLGLSHLQSVRHVVAPQAIRRIIPPLLNDFIGLQKDTALVSFVGLLDAFNQSRIIASNSFNLSAVTGVGLVFVLITVPLARLVDYLTARDMRRTQAGAA
ncbi:MAG TPA: amino acid ABC transporter permease [Jatrophihabitans sp.]|jgi:polar amino acid transport system permease protein|uniref:amino acid ABC transporter permease n=1 Tax=Jatrophihabitans sp. TaxID=1932789 RepID=UPI002F25BB45